VYMSSAIYSESENIKSSHSDSITCSLSVYSLFR